MPAFFLTLLAAAIVTFAGRDQLRVSRIGGTLGAGTGLIVAIIASAIIASAIAAWFSGTLEGMLTPAAKQIFVALALGLAALELLFFKSGKRPAEPTRSAGAIFIVLVSTQIFDAARFLIVALALATGEPILCAIGGGLGGMIALIIGAISGDDWERAMPIALMRYIAAGLLGLAAIVLFLIARGIV